MPEPGRMGTLHEWVSCLVGFLAWYRRRLIGGPNVCAILCLVFTTSGATHGQRGRWA
ncbi:protein of unknown function [Azospirillum lipoferum 4B]|uniref:Uncharacterized protein n=1 Tax=Azospirillum lipoferum (strain 4B) TaxID=862719 RepID=G7Z2A1_AZOL4|nr:protein of unknown function [Azospirillum lipoferum 4B]